MKKESFNYQPQMKMTKKEKRLIFEDAVEPWQEVQPDPVDAINEITSPLRDFQLDNVEENEVSDSVYSSDEDQFVFTPEQTQQ